MDSLTSKAAYLKGLADGMNLDAEKAENKLLLKIIETIGEMAEAVDDVCYANDELEELVHDLDEDLHDVEEIVYDYDDEEDFDDDEDEKDGPQQSFLKDGFQEYIDQIQQAAPSFRGGDASGGGASGVRVTVPRGHYFFSTVGVVGWLALAMESRMVVSAMVFCIW